MSIRKRSETTFPRERPATRQVAGRLATWLVIGGMAAGLLLGCAEGTSQDAAQGQLEDSQRTSVVSDLQATESARVLEPGTPPPDATETIEP